MTAAPHSTARNETAQHNPKTADFDRLAWVYRWMEYASFGPLLWWCRRAFLDELTSCRKAAVFGDGDGRFTARLLTANATIEVDAVDASEAMLRSLMRRAGGNVGRVRTHCTDARAWRPASPPYDLIVTHFFLDCLTTNEARALAVTMRSSVAPGARWIISEFAEPDSRLRHAAAHAIVWLLYRAFGLLTGLGVRTLPDHRVALRDAGFALEKSRTRLGGLLVSELWTAQNETGR